MVRKKNVASIIHAMSVCFETGAVAGNGPQAPNSYNHLDNKMGEAVFCHVLDSVHTPITFTVLRTLLVVFNEDEAFLHFTVKSLSIAKLESRQGFFYCTND